MSEGVERAAEAGRARRPWSGRPHGERGRSHPRARRGVPTGARGLRAARPPLVRKSAGLGRLRAGRGARRATTWLRRLVGKEPPAGFTGGRPRPVGSTWLPEGNLRSAGKPEDLQSGRWAAPGKLGGAGTEDPATWPATCGGLRRRRQPLVPDAGSPQGRWAP